MGVRREKSESFFNSSITISFNLSSDLYSLVRCLIAYSEYELEELSHLVKAILSAILSL